MTRPLPLIGLTFFCFSGSFTFAQTKVLIDFGNNTTFRGASAPGNWNSVGFAYAANLIDKNGQPTTLDYAPDGLGGTDSFNSIAGPTSNPLSASQITTADGALNKTALGDLGVAEAAIDFFVSGNATTKTGRFQIQGLAVGQKYRFTFYGTKQYVTAGNEQTRFTVHADNSYANPLGQGVLTTGTTNGDGNPNQIASFLVIPTASIVYVEWAGVNDSTKGYLNAMSIEKVDSTAPVITLANPNTLRVDLGSTFTDPGATVTDDVDASRTVFGTGTVNTSTLGTYTLTYQATDAAGNPASSVTRTVVVQYAASKTVLLDIGRSNADGGLYGGATPASPDANGNYWNTLDIGKYAGSMLDKTGVATSIGAGFIDINSPVFTTYNGPAGAGTLADVTINSAALGDLGAKEAAFDYVHGTNIRMSINGLVAGKQYRFNFFSSRRWEGDPSTTISVYSGNTFDSGAKLNEGTVANRSSTQEGVHNADALLALDNLTPTGTSLYINIVGGAGGAGALNALSIQELDIPANADTTPPVITVSGNTTETVVWGSSYVDAGATATDNGLPVSVISNSDGVNTSVLGSYQVTYSATDAASNIASASRTVNVVLPVNADVAGPDGLSPLLRYALGASTPDSAVTKPSVTTDADDLILTALIRTSGITVAGQASTDLSSTNGGFADLTSNPNGVLAADQSNLLPGTERREFRTPKDANRKFIRLRVSAP